MPLLAAIRHKNKDREIRVLISQVTSKGPGFNARFMKSLLIEKASSSFGFYLNLIHGSTNEGGPGEHSLGGKIPRAQSHTQNPTPKHAPN
jgi:hypothetical protein